jgi:hypothetical protein
LEDQPSAISAKRPSRSIAIYGQALPCPTAPAMPLDLLWKGLNQNCFGPANIGILQQDTELPNLQFHAQ